MRVSRRHFLAAPLVAVVPSTASARASAVLGQFTTSYRADAEHKGRAFNVELAAEAIDGRTIAPGATFSFNGAVGERTAAFGYARAVVLRDAMIAEGTGGGTCQVASTLHAAALLAALEVVERAPHSRPSAYIRMGLDAVVVYGSIDLRLMNPWPEPVIVRARASRGRLEVSIRGASPKPEVSVRTDIVERMMPSRVIERDRAVPEGRAIIEAFGIPGYRVLRTREVRPAEGSARRDVRVDVYPPTPEIIRAAPSFDASRLSSRGAREDGAPPGPVTVGPGAHRPALVQLRPSTTVVLDNAGRAGEE